MITKKNHIALIFLLIFLPAAGVTGVHYAISKLTEEEKIPRSEPVTSFYVINESEMTTEKPIQYRVTLNNREGSEREYELKVLLAGKEIHNEKILLQDNAISNETITVIPNSTGDIQKLEFLVLKGIDPVRTYVFQLIPPDKYGYIPPIKPSSLQNSKIAEKKIENTIAENEYPQKKTYAMEKNGNYIKFIFDSGEKLELTVTDGNVSEGDAVYSTVGEGNFIMFIRELHEKIFPSSMSYIYPIIMDVKDKKLTINETLNLKNGYSITLRDIKSQNINSETLKIDISKNKRIVREIISYGNSPIEYWHQIDENKKDRIIRIFPISISETEMTFDIIQYGNKRRVLIGDNYEEFKIVNITQDSIIMKNTRPLNLEGGKELSLVNGKIKIKV